MLPKGVKSLNEIWNLDQPVDRARELGFLLEHLLRRLTPRGGGMKFIELLKYNREYLPNFDALESAREARNAIVHGSRAEHAIARGEAVVADRRDAERSRQDARERLDEGDARSVRRKARL